MILVLAKACVCMVFAACIGVRLRQAMEDLCVGDDGKPQMIDETELGYAD